MMASSLTTQNFICSQFSLTPHTSNIPKSFVPSSPSIHKTPHVFKLNFLPRASSQELPGEDEFTEDSKFVPLNAEDPIFGPPVAESLPRICFLSGLTGEEMLMFIDAFPEFGIEPPVFAALVPNSADKPLKDVMEEIMGDHEMMSARQLD